MTAAPLQWIDTSGRAFRRLAEVPARPEHVPTWLQWLTLPASVLLVGWATARGPLTALLALGAVAAGLAVTLRPLLGGLLLVGAVPVTSGLARGFPVPAVRLAEAILLGVAVVVVLVAPKGRGRLWTAVDWLALLYAGGALCFGLVNLGFRGQLPTVAELQVMIGPLQFFLLFRVVSMAVRGARPLVLALRLLLLASLPVSLLGIGQSFQLLDLHRRVLSWTGATVFDTPGWTPLLRATSVFPNWHSLAMYLVPVILVSTALIHEGPSARVLPRRVLAAIVLLSSLALVATLSVAAVVSLAGGLVLLGMLYRQGLRSLATVTCVAVGAGLVFAGPVMQRFDAQVGSTSAGAGSGLPETIAFRLQVWQEQYLPALAGNYLTGYGPGLPAEVTWTHSESLFLVLLLRGGIPLVLLWLALMLVVGDRALRLRGDGDPVRRALANAVLVLTPVVIAADVIWPYFTSSGLPQVLWVLWALLFAPGPVTGSEDGPSGTYLAQPPPPAVTSSGAGEGRPPT